MTHKLNINLEKDGLMKTIETIMDCYRQNEEEDHEYQLKILDLCDEDDEEDEHTLYFNNFPDACRILCFIHTALRKGYELGVKEGGKNE